MAPTEAVSSEVALGAGAAAVQLGLIALTTDETTECDFHRMFPSGSEAMFYTARVKTVNPVTVENLRKMGPLLTDAAASILPDLALRAVAYSCTSGTLVIGYDEVVRRIRDGRPHASRDRVEIVTPLTAAVAACQLLGIRKLGMLTPYIDSANQPMKDFFEGRDIEVVRLKSLLVASDVDIARIEPRSIIAGALETDLPEADALFLSCTALRAVECIDELEARLGKPVLTSNQCMFWQLMKLAGLAGSIPGFGRLLAKHL